MNRNNFSTYKYFSNIYKLKNYKEKIENVIFDVILYMPTKKLERLKIIQIHNVQIALFPLLYIRTF